MSAIVIFFYSKYIPNIQYLLEKINRLSYCHTICVDNQIVRKQVLASPILRTKRVPCFVVINPDRTINQYIDNDLHMFLQRMIDIEEQKVIQSQTEQQQQQPQKRVIDKSPINSVLQQEDFQRSAQKQQQPREEPMVQSNNDMAISSNPSSLTKSDVPIARSKIGEIINYNSNQNQTNNNEIMNYNKDKTLKLKPEEQKSAKMNKGQGHDNMLGMSSLRPDSKKTDIGVIEDIDVNDQSGLISFSNANISTTQPKNPKDDKNDKKVSEFKSIVNQMMQQRESMMDTMRKE